MSIARGDLAQALHDLAEQGRHGDKADRLRLYTAVVTGGDTDTVQLDFGDGTPVDGIPLVGRAPAAGDVVQVLGLPGRFFCLGARGSAGGVSADPGNQLQVGSDGGLYVPRIVTYQDLRDGPAT